MEHITLLADKRIILGVTGSVAAYKAVDLASKLTQAGAQVDVIMTDAARQFVTPITFQAVTGRPVYTTMWQTAAGDGLPTHIAHVGLGEGADLFVVAPITANTLAKLAHGLAADLLAVTALAVRCPVIVAPAMDGGMYQHPATQANIALLQARGVLLIEPDEGRFASGLVGKGRFPDTSTLIGHIRRALGRGGTLAGRHIIVTAGGTREALDPVRYLTNHSSGKQGYALAQAALDAGADVTLISAARDLPVPVGAALVPVDTTENLLRAVMDAIDNADALIMAAAPADFRPAQVAAQKIKKSGDIPALSLSQNPDILMAVAGQRHTSGWPRVVVGFAAESENVLANAQAKLAHKGVDLLVANDITAPDAGFRADTNRVVLLDAAGSQQSLELASKTAVAETVIQRVAGLLNTAS
ncbi:MAG: bifunctional phosphopantothenoylcysteine decarboxylase/phosphopantothenate--cysteine ligase CoaBC [Anaerolineae bacterium]|nr:bifunctional phosphopantothenoylcysteine decarboxylase/phosphopantothenate--cysteine ligase CoaBC [Anaerolineae bacterium]